MSHDPGDEHHPPRTVYPCGMIQVDGKGTFATGYEVIVFGATDPEQATLVITTVKAEDVTPMVPAWPRAADAHDNGDRAKGPTMPQDRR